MLKVKLDYLKIKDQTSQTILLEDVEFQLEKKSIYSILGKNGTGKTSFILSLTKLLNDSNFECSGNVNLFGKDIFNTSVAELHEIRKKETRYVFQDPVGCFNPLKKIKYYFELLNVDQSEINKELDYFQLPAYNELKHMHAYELSVGMAQRINVLLAILAKPKLLFLDEPTSALDLPIVNLLVHRLKDFAAIENRIILIVTQDISFAKAVSDNISLLAEKELTNFYSVNEFDSMIDNHSFKQFIDSYSEIIK
ncbi:MAG: ATP-binding cassette domain-containing protein [Bacteroidota bacterium]